MEGLWLRAGAQHQDGQIAHVSQEPVNQYTLDKWRKQCSASAILQACMCSETFMHTCA